MSIACSGTPKSPSACVCSESDANLNQKRGRERRIWILSELYYPELTSTGYFLTGIAEGLAEKFDVSVFCAQPSYAARGVRAATREIHRGVDVHRCWSTTLEKNRPVFKIINLFTISFSIFFSVLFQVGHKDILICVTNPPLLPYLAAIVSRLKRARLVLLIHDVYPEILDRLGILKRQSIFFRVLDQANRWLYRNADRIIVIGRDMQHLVASKLQTGNERVVIATNWANTEVISTQPRNQNKLLSKLNLTERFVVQFWGNMGRPHCIEDIVDAAELLASDTDIHFLLIGWGVKTPWAMAEKEARALENLTFVASIPRDETCDVQNACDVAINTLNRGMAGISVPSRTYNALAAGRPVVAVCEDDSELASMVREENVGWVVPPGRPDLIAAVIREAKADPDRLLAMGERACRAVEVKYTQSHAIRIYRDIVEDLIAQ